MFRIVLPLLVFVSACSSNETQEVQNKKQVVTQARHEIEHPVINTHEKNDVKKSEEENKEVSNVALKDEAVQKTVEHISEETPKEKKQVASEVSLVDKQPKEKTLEKDIKKEVLPPKTDVIKEELVVEKQVKEIQEIQAVKVDYSIWDNLLRKYVSSNGKVNYKGLQQDKSKLIAFLTILSSNAPNSTWSKPEKLAYWINVYNAFTVKLIVDNYPLKSITDLDKPWDKKFIKIGNTSYSLGDVENNILRKMGEPRIHFAINCASVSCPNLLNTAYIPQKLEKQLSTSTKTFLLDKSKNRIAENPMQLSKLFEWYKGDFEGGNVIKFINKQLNQSIDESTPIKYLEYNWGLNE